MTCTDRLTILSPRLGRAVCVLVQVETMILELERCSRGKSFRVRAQMTFQGLMTTHRTLQGEAMELLEALSEAVEPHFDREWSAWRKRVLERDFVVESAFPASMDEDDIDKHRIHRRWKPRRIDEVRTSVLGRMFTPSGSLSVLRTEIANHMRRLTAPPMRFYEGNEIANVSQFSTEAIRAALTFLASLFSDVSLLTDGFVRSYPGPRSKGELDREAIALTDAILLGDRENLASIVASPVRRLAQRKAYYAGLHSVHDTSVVNAEHRVLFNDREIEQELAYATG
mgnify:CR=1 FL=1